MYILARNLIKIVVHLLFWGQMEHMEERGQSIASLCVDMETIINWTLSLCKRVRVTYSDFLNSCTSIELHYFLSTINNTGAKALTVKCRSQSLPLWIISIFPGHKKIILKTWPCITQRYTSSILNYNSFDFFDHKFAHSSYSKLYVKYHFFCCDLLY